MKYNKERRLFTAFTITIAILFVLSYFFVKPPIIVSEENLYENEIQALHLKTMKSEYVTSHPDRKAIQERNEKQKYNYFESVNALLNAEKVTLYALEPRTYYNQSPLLKEVEEKKFDNLPYAPPPQYIAGVLLLGQTELKGKDIEIAAQAYREAVGGAIAMCSDCYAPRHAIRAEYQGHIYDYVICYECFFTNVYKNGEYFLSFGGRMNAERTVSLTDLLKKYNVPLPYIFTEQAKKDYEAKEALKKKEEEKQNELPMSLPPENEEQ